MRSYEDVEAMDISDGGKLVGYCYVHLLKYMKEYGGPINPADLMRNLNNEADRERIPFSRGYYIRQECYKAAFTSALAEGYIRRSRDFTVVWHEYVKDDE